MHINAPVTLSSKGISPVTLFSSNKGFIGKYPISDLFYELQFKIS